MAALNEFLLRTHGVGQNNVLIIDEAQSLSADVLEQLRLLTNLETSERKLLQIILIGQPELRDMLARPELEQLAQRVIARYHLDALTPRETSRYIQHRLSVAGLSRALPFDEASMRRIHVLARGVPRRINLLCDRALAGRLCQRQGDGRCGHRRQGRGRGAGPGAARRRGAAGWRSRRARLGATLGLGVLLGAVLFGCRVAGLATRCARRRHPPARRSTRRRGSTAMSYILEALRKADAERERGTVPDLHAQLLPGAADDDERRHRVAHAGSWPAVGPSRWARCWRRGSSWAAAARPEAASPTVAQAPPCSAPPTSQRPCLPALRRRRARLCLGTCVGAVCSAPSTLAPPPRRSRRRPGRDSGRRRRAQGRPDA